MNDSATTGQSQASVTSSEVSFETCPGCGFHGRIIFHHVNGTGVGPLRGQPEAQSQEAAIMQVIGLAVDHFIDFDGAHQLTQQILSSNLPPTQAVILPWTMEMRVIQIRREIDDRSTPLGKSVGALTDFLTDLDSAKRRSSQG